MSDTPIQEVSETSPLTSETFVDPWSDPATPTANIPVSYMQGLCQFVAPAIAGDTRPISVFNFYHYQNDILSATDCRCYVRVELGLNPATEQEYLINFRDSFEIKRGTENLLCFTWQGGES